MRPLLLGLSLLLLTVPAFAEGDDLSAVMQACGEPSAQQQGVSQVTNRMERTLLYGSVVLHFQRVSTGWGFLSGWYDHLPLTRSMVERRLPCFRDAMQTSANQVTAPAAIAEDPTVREQSATPPLDASTFGIPHLWLILVLIGALLVLVFLPTARRRTRDVSSTEAPRYRRRPALDRFTRRGPGSRLDM